MGAGSTALGNALLRGKQDAGLSEAPNHLEVVSKL
jgi:hypothetical protein